VRFFAKWDRFFGPVNFPYRRKISHSVLFLCDIIIPFQIKCIYSLFCIIYRVSGKKYPI